MYLEACLESVTGQTLKDIEIICVDDCSTDCSCDILNKYAAADNRIKLLHNDQNYGQSYSRNRGIEIAQGDYIYFLDSDDMITPEALRELYIAAENQRLDALFFDCTLIFEDELLQKKFVSYSPERKVTYSGIFTGKELFVQFIRNEDWTASPPRQFWRRAYIIEHGLSFYEGIIHEDELFSFLALMKAARVSCIKKKYFIRRFRQNSTMTSSISKKNFEGKFICYCKMLEYWQISDFDETTNNAVDLYISRLYNQAKSIFNATYTAKDGLDQGNAFTKHLFKMLVSNTQGKLCSHIDKHKLDIIKQYNHVIIYGAGIVARDVLSILDRNEIAIHGFAVTDKAGNPIAIMGTRVYCIDELYEYRDSAIVLVAVVQRNQKMILDKLEDLRFKNIMQIM